MCVVEWGMAWGGGSEEGASNRALKTELSRKELRQSCGCRGHTRQRQEAARLVVSEERGSSISGKGARRRAMRPVNQNWKSETNGNMMFYKR